MRTKPTILEYLQAKFSENKSKIFEASVSLANLKVTQHKLDYTFGPCCFCESYVPTNTKARTVDINVWYTYPDGFLEIDWGARSVRVTERKVVCRDLQACEYRASVGTDT